MGSSSATCAEATLASLRAQFHPKKYYSLPEYGIDISVEGIFIQVTDDMCMQLSSDNGMDLLHLDVEDILQDPNVIRSARTSTGRDTEAVNEKAQGLIRYLYGERHESPFEGGVVIKLKCRMPVRHAEPIFQSPGSFNEASRRYWKYRESDGAFVPPGASVAARDIYNRSYESKLSCYANFFVHGMALEQARLVLPYGFFTEFYWTVSLRHLLELLALEPNSLAPKAFWEMCNGPIHDIVKEWAPWTYVTSEERPRIIPTNYFNDAFCDWNEMRRSLEDLWTNAEIRKNVGAIGSIALVNTWGSDKLMKLGVWTGPNPRRGFGHAGMTVLIKVPIFVHRQLIRHRYAIWTVFPTDFDAIVKSMDFYTPYRFREQIGNVGHYKYLPVDDGRNDMFRADLKRIVVNSAEDYAELRHRGVSAGRAALVLPYNFRVRRLLTANVESWMNIFSLRLDERSQGETRLCVEAIFPWFGDRFPWAKDIFLRKLNWGKSSLLKK